MKAIDLLTHETYSIKLDPKPFGYTDADELTVEFTVKRLSEMAKIEVRHPVTGEVLGELDTKVKEDLVQVRRNTGNIISTTIVIEQKISDIISNYLFGAFRPNTQRDFFEREILCSSRLSSAAKIPVLLKILDELKYFEVLPASNDKRKKDTKKKAKEFEDLLRKVLEYRNAFAHGELKYESPTGCILNYHSRDRKKCVLDEKFWDKLEDRYQELLEILNKIKKASCEGS